MKIRTQSYRFPILYYKNSNVCKADSWSVNDQLRLCNYLQNVVATTYKNILQLYGKSACKKHFLFVRVKYSNQRKAGCL